MGDSPAVLLEGKGREEKGRDQQQVGGTTQKGSPSATPQSVSQSAQSAQSHSFRISSQEISQEGEGGGELIKKISLLKSEGKRETTDYVSNTKGKEKMEIKPLYHVAINEAYQPHSVNTW